MRSVGVRGEKRTYDYTLALRAVATSDFMTAEWAGYRILSWKGVSRIVNEVPKVNRVVYDITRNHLQQLSGNDKGAAVSFRFFEASN